MASTENPVLPGTTYTGMDDYTETMDRGGIQRVKDTAAQFGRSAADTIDRNLESAAGALERSADKLRSHATDPASKMTNMAQTAADKLENTARYFRENHTRDLISGCETAMRRNPGASIAVALAAGFLIGMAMRRDHD